MPHYKANIFINKNKMKRPSLLLSASLLCFIINSSSIAQAGSSLTREEIMRQHQALQREHEGLSSSTGDDGLAPPVSGVSSGSDVSSASMGATSGKSDNNLTAQLLERVSALEGQVRQLRGEVDNLTNKQQQDEENTAKQLGDMQFALQNGGTTAHVSQPKAAEAASSSAEKGTTASAEQPQTALEALKQARTALKARHYSEAEKLSRYALANAHSASGKLESQYLLASSLVGEKQYHESATEYYDVYSKDPKSSYAASSLLGVSYSMLNAGSKPAACEALSKLGKEYPSSTAYNGARAKMIADKASCHH